jgi:hypothetical protein
MEYDQNYHCIVRLSVFEVGYDWCNLWIVFDLGSTVILPTSCRPLFRNGFTWYTSGLQRNEAAAWHYTDHRTRYGECLCREVTLLIILYLSGIYSVCKIVHTPTKKWLGACSATQYHHSVLPSLMSVRSLSLQRLHTFNSNFIYGYVHDK